LNEIKQKLTQLQQTEKRGKKRLGVGAGLVRFWCGFGAGLVRLVRVIFCVFYEVFEKIGAGLVRLVRAFFSRRN